MFSTICRALFSLSLSFGLAHSAFAAMEDVPTFGDMANTLISGTNVITKLVLMATVVMGAGFIIFAISSYRQHRLTPKLVPLDRPVLYLVLGLCLCALPFLGDIFGVQTYSTIDLQKRQKAQALTNKHQRQQSTAYYDIDAPLDILDEQR